MTLAPSVAKDAVGFGAANSQGGCQIRNVRNWFGSQAQRSAGWGRDRIGAAKARVGELLIDELRDILHAEKQLTKAARFDQLRELFERHLLETEQQIERLNECFSVLGVTARAKPCTAAGHPAARTGRSAPTL
jgi:hypothetical protein